MRRDENWAIEVGRIRAFFREQTDVREDNDLFVFGRCSISLIPLSGTSLGKWQIPRTRVLFEGDESDVETIHRRFFLRFLSAGG